VSDWFQWLYEQARAADPTAILTNKPTQITLFQPASGVDMEAQARLFDLAGADTWRRYTPRSEFAVECLEPGLWKGLGVMVLDFFRSAAPEKPAADVEYHFAHHSEIKEVPAAYVRAALWQSFLHGMRMCCLWVWRRRYREDAMVQYPPFARPQVAWAAGATALDLRRLAREVSLFPPGPAEAVLLYSRTSVFHEPERSFHAVLTAYKSMFFLDAPLGFVTERRIEKGDLTTPGGRPRLLVIAWARHAPDAVYRGVVEFARTGGRVVLMEPDALAFDEHGRRRSTAELSRIGSVLRFPREGAEELSRRFDNLFDAAGVNRPVRVLALDGTNAWGVESRSVVRAGRVTAYLINLRSDPVTVRIRGLPANGRWVDRITMKAHRGSVWTLEPLQTVLLTPEAE